MEGLAFRALDGHYYFGGLEWGIRLNLVFLFPK